MTLTTLTNDQLDAALAIAAEGAMLQGLATTNHLDALFAERSRRIATRQAEIKAGGNFVTYGEIGPMVMEDHDGDYKWSGDRSGDTLQPVTLNGEHVGNLARCYRGEEGEGMRLICYHWRPVNGAPCLLGDDDEDYVFQYSSARVALAAKKAQIAAALGA